MFSSRAIRQAEALVPAFCETKVPEDRKNQSATKSHRHKKVLEFERDYPTFLLSLAATIRAGVDPIAAFLINREMFAPESLLRVEIDKFSELIDKGNSETEAIQQFGYSVPHPDLPLFRTALQLSVVDGSPLGPALERLARVTRRRQSFRKKARGAVAMQRMSAFGILVCALSVALFQLMVNSDQILNSLSHPAGLKAYSLGATLLFGGVVWLGYITRSRV
jgi:Flp pilus assembly protein TadB